MDPETLLAGLAARAEQLTSPGRKFIFFNAKDAHAKIGELETLLGVNPSPMICNLREANARVQQLHGMLAAKVAATPPPPAPVTEDFPGASIIAAYEAVSHPADKVSFYRENKAAIDRAYRDAPPLKFTHKPTGVTVVDQMNALEDPQERVRFYRKNKATIDAAHKFCKSKYE